MSTSTRPVPASLPDRPAIQSALAQYQTWEGGFSDLVQQANHLLAQLNSPLLTERTARHYQASGVLGHGTRQGKSAQFNYQDLCTLVSTKVLATANWGLDKLSLLYSSGDQQYGCVADSLLREASPLAPSLSSPSASPAPAPALVSATPPLSLASLPPGSSSPASRGFEPASPLPNHHSAPASAFASSTLTPAQRVLAELSSSVSVWSTSVAPRAVLPVAPLHSTRGLVPPLPVSSPLPSSSLPSSSLPPPADDLPALLARLNDLLVKHQQVSTEISALRQQISSSLSTPPSTHQP